MMCEMCGNKPGTFVVDVEGTRMTLCQDCSTFGKVIAKTAQEQPRTPKRQAATIQAQQTRNEVIFIIVPDYGLRIKRKREQLGLKQEELAKKLSEKESLLHQVESGKFVPSIPLARKFEKMLGIALVEEHREQKSATTVAPEEEWTIGDVLNRS